MLNFDAIIKKHEGIDGAYVEVPFDIDQIFGARRVKVKVKFDNCDYRGSIVNMSGCYLIGITKEIREKINKCPGDIVSVIVEKDEEERNVVLSKDFEQALQSNSNAKQNYEKLSYTNKKKYNVWIESAKKEETRVTRIEKTLEMLNDNKIL
jgi:bifunctional DNA-binding transcriptional regulator/antitoxin component of YhaV-PrlF toxin-antitoxin module